MWNSREGPAEEEQDPQDGAVQVRAVAQVHPDGRPLREAPGRKLAQGQALVHRRRPLHQEGDRTGLTAEPKGASRCGHDRLPDQQSLSVFNSVGGTGAGPRGVL
jgi:hypothetical protein